MNRALLPIAMSAPIVVALVVLVLRARVPTNEPEPPSEVRADGSIGREKRPRSDVRVAVMNEWRGHVLPCQCQAKDLGDSAAQIGELSRVGGDRGLDAVLYVGNVLGTNPDDEDENTLSARTSTMRRELSFTVLAAAKPAAIVPGVMDWKDRRGTDRLRREHAVVCTNATFDGPLRELVFPAGDVVVRLLGIVLAPNEDARFADATTTITDALNQPPPAGGKRRLDIIALCADDTTSTDDLLRAVRTAGTGTIVFIGGKIEPETWESVARDADDRGIALMRSDVLGQQWALIDASVVTSGPRAAWKRRTNAAPGSSSEGPRAAAVDDECDEYSVEEVPIKDHSPRDPAIAEALARYRADLQSLVNSRQLSARTTSSPFHGRAACEQCHQSIARQWAATPHSRAYATLVAAGRQRDPQCLACHTTGFGADGGFIAPDAVPDLADVQCESCHGAGGSHRDAATRTTGKPRDACSKCHDPMNSPHFHLEQYLPRVACRKSDPDRQEHK
jgi:hypothetical protein